MEPPQLPYKTKGQKTDHGKIPISEGSLVCFLMIKIYLLQIIIIISFYVRNSELEERERERDTLPIVDRMTRKRVQDKLVTWFKRFKCG